MGAGGVTRQTGRRNTIMPYNVGFLNNAEDTKNYNVAVYDELQKVSSASTHMFQAIDNIHQEIDTRIDALNAMNLSFNAATQTITTTMNTKFNAQDLVNQGFTTKFTNIDGSITTINSQISTINTFMGNIDTDDIKMASNPAITLSGHLQGVATDITTVSTGVTTLRNDLTGQITTLDTTLRNQITQEVGVLNGSVTTQFGTITGQISVINNTMSAQRTDINTVTGQVSTISASLSNYMLLTTYEAQWAVDADVAGHKGGIGFVTRTTSPGVTTTDFLITSDRFRIKDATTGNYPFQVVNGVTRIKDARIEFAQIDNVVIDNAKIAGLAITSDKIATGAVGSGQIAGGAVGSGQIAGGAVGTNHIANGAISNDKLDAAISSANYVPGQTGWLLGRAGGTLEFNGATPGQGRLVITNTHILIYDAAGTLRVRIGQQ